MCSSHGQSCGCLKFLVGAGVDIQPLPVRPKPTSSTVKRPELYCHLRTTSGWNHLKLACFSVFFSENVLLLPEEPLKTAFPCVYMRDATTTRRSSSPPYRAPLPSQRCRHPPGLGLSPPGNPARSKTLNAGFLRPARVTPNYRF